MYNPFKKLKYNYLLNKIKKEYPIGTKVITDCDEDFSKFKDGFILPKGSIGTVISIQCDGCVEAIFRDENGTEYGIIQPHFEKVKS